MGTDTGHPEQFVMNDVMPSLDSGGMETTFEVACMFCHLMHLHGNNTAPNVVLYCVCYYYYHIFSMCFDGLQEVCNHLLLLLLSMSSLNPNSNNIIINVKQFNLHNYC